MNQIIGDMVEEPTKPNDQKEEEEQHHSPSPIRSLASQFSQMSISEESKSPTHHYVVPAPAPHAS